MDKNSNSFTVSFAVTICVVLAIGLAATYNGLKATIDENARFDKQTNVLIAMGLYAKSQHKPREELEALYRERVVGEVLEVKRATVQTEVRSSGETRTVPIDKVVDLAKTEHDVAALADLRREEQKKPPAERREYVAIYRGQLDDGKTVWCIPIEGYGLWSTLYGFLALAEDLNTVVGITFYKHGETPGLGGEVDNVGWQHSWRGKTVLDERGAVVGITVKKGQVDPEIEREKRHMVDGLSGSTITSNGVTRFVKKDLETYEPYFKKLRKA